MVDIPEQAVKAATEQFNTSDMTLYDSYTKGQEAMVSRMLTAAAPYMSAPSRAQALEEILRELSGNPRQLIDMMASAIRVDGSDLCDGSWESLSYDRKQAWRGDTERALAAVKEYLTTRVGLSGGGNHGQ